MIRVAPAAPSISFAERDRVGIEQFAALHHNARVAAVCAFSAQIIFTAIMLRLGVIEEGRGVVWFVLGAAAIAGQLALGRRWSSSQAWRRSAWWFTAYTVLEGLLWGCAFLFILPDDVGIRMLYVSMLLGIAAGAVVAFGSFLPACLAFLATATLPCFIWMLLQGNTFYYGAALLLVLLDFTLVIMARDNDARFLATVSLRFANETLAENLRLQRDAAERANAAKSRFLAAASHDLRQPVHALSMLAEAFSIADMSEPNRRVVALIDRSVASLNKLFDALLDISRLDAGLVVVHREPVAIGPLLARLAGDFRLICEAKGLRLVLHPCRLIVDTDPILLERILRNLIDNGVRYTDRGRVVIGCRREGLALRVEVWDTGRGIAAEDQARVFQEFEQLQNPERDRAKGLGLGLAIVHRLSVLLDQPVTLRSTLGCGSCFRIHLPVCGTGLRTAAAAGAAPPPLSGAGRCIAVIDDEAAAREAARLMLERWGHTVLLAGSADELIAQFPDAGPSPDVLLCDYRLRHDESGISCVARVRAVLGRPVPAILVTGDTAPARLLEATSSGLILLHKPIVVGKLRAALASLRPFVVDEPVRQPPSAA